MKNIFDMKFMLTDDICMPSCFVCFKATSIDDY